MHTLTVYPGTWKQYIRVKLYATAAIELHKKCRLKLRIAYIRDLAVSTKQLKLETLGSSIFNAMFKLER
jgi:hypothetical protein